MYGQVKEDIRELLKKLCEYKKLEILKGKSALMIFDKHPKYEDKWNRAFWVRGYYITTIWVFTEDAIKTYIENQQEESKKEDQRIRNLF